ncbi:MAG: TIGR02221 family CRISPR-associated protein [Paludibacteraceae bacterium]
MARKVFMSILGTGPYSECTYSADGQDIMTTRYVQLATLKHVINLDEQNNNKWTDKDAAIIFVTKKSEEEQWIKGIAKLQDSNKIIELEGLKAMSEKENFPIPMRSKKIVDGKNNDEIWKIFNDIYEEIGKGDELYFDITHAFRYLPMLLLVLINYAKFLKNVTVKSITYGNFMAEGESKPIMNLTSISQLQDWTFAAGQYLENGSVNRLVSLCEQEFRPILKETQGTDETAKKLRTFITRLSAVTEERKTCRGLDIIRSTSFKDLKESADKLDETFIDAFNPIFEQIKFSLVSFDENENVRNGFSAAVWCYDNGLFQQSATILQEFVISFFCLRHNIRIDDEENREIINKAFNIKFNKTPEEGWIITDEKIEKLKQVLADDLFDNYILINSFNSLTEVRNDFNHSGMRSKRNPMKPQTIKDNIKKCICAFGVILFKIKID